MIIRKLFLEGYGRFSGREIEFADGLQVVLGANEQGKTTMRHFILDMLFGQIPASSPPNQNQALRRPWGDNGPYGGRMRYCLDDGQEFEIRRTFANGPENIEVFDHTRGLKIPATSEPAPGAASRFAEQHLGLNRTVFANVAVIGHASLESLGDDDALAQIGEKIASLTDAADEAGSAAAAVKRLDVYAAQIGRPASTSKRPLPLAKARLALLEAELETVRTARDEVAAHEQRLRAARGEIRALQEEQTRLEQQLRRLEHTEKVIRLQKAEAVQHQIETLTQRLFTLARAKDFPLEQEDVFNRALNAVETAREQTARTEARAKELLRRHRDACADLENDAVEIHDLPERFEEQLKELDAQVARLRDFADDLEQAHEAACREIERIDEQLSELPDFTELGEEPVAWIHQHTNAFSLAQQERDRAVEARKRLDAERERRLEALALPEEVFAKFSNFPAEAREYAVESKLTEERCAQQRKRIEEAQRDIETHEEDLPNVRVMAIFGALLAILLAVVAVVTGNKGIYIVEVFALGVFVYNAAHWIHARMSLRQQKEVIESAEAEIARIEAENAAREEDMQERIAQAKCGSFRELEALYEGYVKDRHELGAVLEELAQHEHHARVEEAHVEQRLERIKEVFSRLGETIENEHDVHEAAAHAIAAYQRRREATHRRDEQQRQLDNLSLETRRAADKLAAKESEEKRLSLEVRKLLRKAGYREEANHTSALAALRAYAIRIAQLRPRRASADALKQQADEFEQQLEQDRRDLEQAQEELAQLLDNVGVDSVDEYRALAAQAREYREARIKRTSLGEQLDTLLGSDSLEDLRDGLSQIPNGGQLSLEQGPGMKAALDRVQQQLEARGKEAHALELAIAERSAGLRTINEIEEERAVVAQRAEVLQRELDAAAHAAAIIEEVARARHTQIVPALAKTASRYLSQITGGVYTELALSSDLQVTVAIPEAGKRNASPRKHLSKGTVDQVYLALRLALVANLCEKGERVPMVLDDPFANYDDARLARALALLAELTELPQILLFTCREDVAEAAQGLGVPVLAL